MWDDNGITSHSKMQLLQKMRELIEEGSGTKSGKSVVDDTCAEEEDAGMMIKTKKKSLQQFSFDKSYKNSGEIFKLAGNMPEIVEE